MTVNPTVRDCRASTVGVSVDAVAGRLCLLIQPFASEEAIDITDAITRAVAHEIWSQVGGNGTLNWLEAEHLVASLLGQAYRAQPVNASSVGGEVTGEPSETPPQAAEEAMVRSITAAVQEIAGSITPATGAQERPAKPERPKRPRSEAIPA